MSTETPAKSDSRPSFTLGFGRTLLPIRSVKGRVRLQGKGAIYQVEQGEATIGSGATAFAYPGTNIKANSGSVVLAFEGAEVTAHKRAVVIWVK